jgi:hypothetical protein
VHTADFDCLPNNHKIKKKTKNLVVIIHDSIESTIYLSIESSIYQQVWRGFGAYCRLSINKVSPFPSKFLTNY